MDPNATWHNLCVALKAKDWQEVIDSADTLTDWLLKGSFFPTDVVLSGMKTFEAHRSIDTWRSYAQERMLES